VCVVDDAGKVCASASADRADDIAVLLTSSVVIIRWIEAGPLSRGLVKRLSEARLPVICVETRHMKCFAGAQSISPIGTMRAGSPDDAGRLFSRCM